MLDTLVSWAARRSKALAGWIIFRTGLHRLLRRDDAVILLFHRVNDVNANDPLTYSSSKFEDFVRFFGRYYTVVPLTAILQLLETGGDLRGSLAISGRRSRPR